MSSSLITSSTPFQQKQTERRRVRQLSSVRAWCQTNGMDMMDSDNECEIATYQSFPDLRKMLEEECAEIERKELETKAHLEAARTRRRNSDPPHGDSASCSESSTAATTPTAFGYSKQLGNGSSSPSGIIGSLCRLFDPIIPALTTTNNSSGK